MLSPGHGLPAGDGCGWLFLCMVCFLSPTEACLVHFATNGVNAIPVALQSTSQCAIKLKNLNAVQESSREVTSLYEDITEVKQFGRNRIVCESANLKCVLELLRCTSFGSCQVRAFITSHLACVKGFVGGVDADANELLNQFAHLGVVEEYRCSAVKEGNRLPTESCILTFAGTQCPSEMKVWPLIFRVDSFQQKLRQCKNCQKYGHGFRNCQSSPRYKICAGPHAEAACTASEARCSLYENAHTDDSEICSISIR